MFSQWTSCWFWRCAPAVLFFCFLNSVSASSGLWVCLVIIRRRWFLSGIRLVMAFIQWEALPKALRQAFGKDFSTFEAMLNSEGRDVPPEHGWPTPQDFLIILYCVTLYTMNWKQRQIIHFAQDRRGFVILFIVEWCNSTNAGWKDLRRERLAELLNKHWKASVGPRHLKTSRKYLSVFIDLFLQKSTHVESAVTVVW